MPFLSPQGGFKHGFVTSLVECSNHCTTAVHSLSKYKKTLCLFNLGSSPLICSSTYTKVL
ncbi:hypothetical protein SK128_005877 [Halocaridina rubra]|uniref:Uncharacterized protein n=1 Tax=Halocaridina rubra TaxID=373956 RepID=A0AAN9A9F7_HALRR